jgi:acyl-CoA thioester hydrolase
VSAWSAPVRYAECDQQGVVFNAHYLMYADEAVVQVLAGSGVTYQELLGRGLDTSVVASELQWFSPARYGDVVDVDGQVERVGRTSFTVGFSIAVADRVCCRVRTTYVVVDGDRTPTPVPEDVRQAWVSPAAAP